MLYLTPKSEYKHVLGLFVAETRYLETYMTMLRFIEANQLHTFPPNVLPQPKQEEYVQLIQQYRSQRDAINRSLPLASQIADKYGAGDVTSYFLEATEFPDYSVVRPRFFAKEDDTLWQDSVHRLLGYIELARKNDIKTLLNPINWVYLPLRSLLRLPTSLLGITGTVVGKFWDKAVELLAMFLMLVVILFVLYWFFGVPSDKIRDIIIKRLEGGK
jgi:hypothetical protein